MFPDAFIQGSLADKTFLRTDKSGLKSKLVLFAGPNYNDMSSLASKIDGFNSEPCLILGSTSSVTLLYIKFLNDFDSNWPCMQKGFSKVIDHYMYYGDCIRMSQQCTKQV